MGGSDKAFALLGGRPLIAHAAAKLAGQCGAVAISANGDPARFSAWGMSVLFDAAPDFPGPLAGVLAGLEHAQAGGFGFVASLSVDAPFAPVDLVARLAAARSAAGADIGVARSGGRLHHAIALWPTALAADLRRALLGEGVRKVASFASRYRLALADWPDAPFDPFFNVNSPADLAAAEERAKASGV